MLDLAAPLPAGAGEEILHLQGRVVGQLELPKRQLEVAAMRAVGIEIDGDEQDIVEARSHLAVEEDLVVEGVVEGEIAEIVKCWIIAADRFSCEI